jgi:alkanesulfonate monooxygenase SsuD/methylene tetrahydromethanopterin reductase-like flavin-dependent oxidoreductase (luciferase family)
MEEGVEILKQAWTQERVNFVGQHWKIENIPVYPKPVQEPHPPLAFAVTSPETIAWTAKNGYAMLSSGLGTPLHQTIASRDAYINSLREHGHRQAEIEQLMRRWVVTKHVYVAPTDAEAIEDARGPEMWYRDSFIRSLSADGLPGLDESVYRASEAMIQRLQAQTWEDLYTDALVIGSPETVAGKVAQLQQIGVGEMVCWMNFGGIPAHKVRRSMRLFAQEVMPRFQPVAAHATA